jgi:hypothetical protein
MRIISQKSNNLNTYDFFYYGLTKNYIDAVSFNITYTKDNKIVVFNTTTSGAAITNTINNSTLDSLQGYEVNLLNNTLEKLNQGNFKKQIYINLVPSNYDILTDENIKEITESMNNYIDKLKIIINNYPNLIINLHSINRSLVTILKQKIPNRKIGFVVSEDDFNYIDVDYYIILANIVNDSIIDLLIKNKKEVNIYIYSDYYISYIYEHYLGEKSTPIMQETFNKLGIISSYPEIINKVFKC